MGASKNLINSRFGRLTVLKKTTQRNKNGSIYWECLCDCGNKINVTTQSLTRKGRGTKSCGCLNRELSILKNTDNIIGKKYNMLTVISQAFNNKDTSRGAWWYCNCDCGNKNILVKGNRLKQGITKSCGCLNSSAERDIKEIFDNKHINYSSQYTFADCRSPITNWLLKFDFAIFNDQGSLLFLLEYDGEQHFYGCRFSKNKEERDLKNQRILINDNYKNKYCKQNNINLYRINYKQRYKIAEIIDEILAKEIL